MYPVKPVENFLKQADASWEFNDMGSELIY